MTFFFVTDWLVVLCQILGMVFGYVRYKKIKLEQSLKTFKGSITHSDGSSTDGSSSNIRLSGNFGEESSSDDDDY